MRCGLTTKPSDVCHRGPNAASAHAFVQSHERGSVAWTSTYCADCISMRISERGVRCRIIVLRRKVRVKLGVPPLDRLSAPSCSVTMHLRRINYVSRATGASIVVAVICFTSWAIVPRAASAWRPERRYIRSDVDDVRRAKGPSRHCRFCNACDVSGKFIVNATLGFGNRHTGRVDAVEHRRQYVYNVFAVGPRPPIDQAACTVRLHRMVTTCSGMHHRAGIKRRK